MMLSRKSRPETVPGWVWVNSLASAQPMLLHTNIKLGKCVGLAMSR